MNFKHIVFCFDGMSLLKYKTFLSSVLNKLKEIPRIDGVDFPNFFF